METVRLLDSYRMAVTRDPDAILILAYLHRDGPQTELDLAAVTHLPLWRARQKLTELFRASFVTVVEERYATSEMAEQVLAHLGIPDVAARETLSKSSLPDEDKALLVAFLRTRDHEPAEWRRYLAAAVKATAQLQKLLILDDDSRRRVWYAVLAGLDPATHELGPEISCEAALAQADFSSASLKVDLPLLQRRCYIALKDRAASNDFIATGRRSDSAAELEVMLSVTFVRLLASLLSSYTDDGITAAASTTGLDRGALNLLGTWSRPFMRECIQALNFPWHIKHRRDDLDLIDSILAAIPGVAVRWGQIAALAPDARQRGTISAQLIAIEEQVEQSTVDSRDKRASVLILDRIRKRLVEHPQKSRGK